MSSLIFVMAWVFLVVEICCLNISADGKLQCWSMLLDALRETHNYYDYDYAGQSLGES